MAISAALLQRLVSPERIPHQPFCHNAEGWGPLSAFRYDFTPCFIDVPVALVSLFGIIPGALALWRLLATQSRQPTTKDWHFYSKLVGLELGC
jgi:ATP-binding cassette subfamily C (CFTR/MRP) protein 1